MLRMSLAKSSKKSMPSRKRLRMLIKTSWVLRQKMIRASREELKSRNVRDLRLKRRKESVSSKSLTSKLSWIDRKLLT